VAKDVFKTEGEIRKWAYTLNNIGITLIEKERYEEARGNLFQALEVAGTVKDESLMVILNLNLADLSLKLDSPVDALKYCRTAEAHLEGKGVKNSQLVEAKKLAGRVAIHEERFADAGKLFDEALEICEQLKLRFTRAEVLFEKGRMLLKLDKHMEALQTLEDAFHQFQHLDITNRVEKTEHLIKSIEDLYLKVFEAMANKVDQKDPYTKGHSDRVAGLVLHLAQKLGLTDSEIKEVVAGALLHDIGKLRISNDILKKKGKLTGEEFSLIKNHPDLGAQILSEVHIPWDVIPLIRYHHEQFDGSGYPCGLNRESIPRGARIICIADVFDALTSDRPYRKAFSPEEALQIMKAEMARAFDPVMLDTFEALLESGEIDNIINRKTDSDEMYRIWEQCRLNPENILP
jgi:putative nucleotidyltransferase with HDIG domain